MYRVEPTEWSSFLIAGVAGGFVLIVLVWALGGFASRSQAALAPMMNGKAAGELLLTNAMKRWKANSRDIIERGFAKSPRGFYTITENGKELVLAPKYADLVRNDKRFSFHGYRLRTLHANISGLNVFALDEMGKKLLRYVIGHKLTQNLGNLIELLSEEASDALGKKWNYRIEDGWHQVGVKESVLAIISQQSTRVFLGQEFCRDDRWLNTTARVTVLAFQAVEQVRMWPAIVRPIAAQFLPVFQRLRAEIQTARKMIDPIVQQRRRVKAQVLAQGKTPVPSLDTIEWAEELADGHEYDPAVLQLTITLSAMHNTTDFMTQLLYDLAARPELVQELRQEIISVRQQYSWSKQAIFNLKLMDSVMKESQRLKPTSLVTMRRTAEATFILPDGPLVQKGDLVMVSTNNHWDPEIYPKPDKFDPYRFLRLLEQEQWGSAPHMVSTCENHLGFGHGTWACSGRFFAVAETKVALCHILMKYDLKLVGDPPPPVINGTFISANPSGKIAIRRRQEEDML